jgi:hypothetical protein
MSWLRKRINDEWAGGRGDAPDTETIAREFAERALRAHLAESLPNPHASGKIEQMRLDLIAAALAAADEEG